MEIFKNIDIQREDTSIAFLIEEALEEKAHFAKSGRNALQIKPTIKIHPYDLNILRSSK